MFLALILRRRLDWLPWRNRGLAGLLLLLLLLHLQLSLLHFL